MAFCGLYKDTSVSIDASVFVGVASKALKSNIDRLLFLLHLASLFDSYGQNRLWGLMTPVDLPIDTDRLRSVSALTAAALPASDSATFS